MIGVSKTVLVVEDESLIRRFISTILRGEGFEVLHAADAAQAEQIWNQHRGAIDLLILDCMLPDGNGFDLARRFAETRPDLKVIFMSGLEEAWISAQLNSSRIFLAKPFQAAEMQNALARFFRAGIPAVTQTGGEFLSAVALPA